MSEHRHKKTRTQNNNFCRFIKNLLWSMFLLLRYYLDLLIDKTFGWYYNSKRQQIKKSTNPILLQSATSLAKKIRNRELKSEEVVQAFIDRINEVNPVINAVVDHRFEKALAEARAIDKDIENGTILDVDFQEKPFLGVPFTSKESTACEGLSSTFGLKKRAGRKATFDAEVITLMKKSGAILLGCTNIPQLNLWQETSNPLYGTTNNPYDTTRNVGGSSGGESSILAAAGSPIGIGTDIGGSCRIPAFMCGVYGHKTTSHLISTKGVTFRNGKEEVTMVVCGPMTRYVEDIPRMLQVLTAENSNKLKLNHPVNVKNLKVYYVEDPQDPFVSPFRAEMKKVLADAVNHFAEICSEKPTKLEINGAKYVTKLWRYWMLQETNANFRNDINNREGEVNAIVEILKYFTVGTDYTLAVVYNLIHTFFPKISDKWAREETEKLKAEFTSKLDEDSVLLYPSSPWTAGYHHTALLRPWNFNLFTIWNVLKFPATQVPMGVGEDGLPLGLQVVAAPFQDRLCIAVAKELEARFGGYVPPFETK